MQDRSDKVVRINDRSRRLLAAGSSCSSFFCGYCLFQSASVQLVQLHIHDGGKAVVSDRFIPVDRGRCEPVLPQLDVFVECLTQRYIFRFILNLNQSGLIGDCLTVYDIVIVVSNTDGFTMDSELTAVSSGRELHYLRDSNFFSCY